MVVVTARDSAGNRLTGVLKDLLRIGIQVSYPLRPCRAPYVPAPCPPTDPRVGCPVLPSGLPSFSRWEFCPPTPDPPETVWAFTDGSYSGPDASGYAALLCKESSLQAPGFQFNSDWCLILRGGSPHSGANYSSECAAIVSSLKALPLNCPIRFVSDALSAIQSISRPLLASGRRIRLGARSLVLTAMDFVGLRRSAGGSTGFDHVHSHTEREDL